MRARLLSHDAVRLAVPGVAVLALVVMQESFPLWRHEWGWGWVQWAAQTQLTGPVSGGLAAWVMYDSLRAGRDAWLASTTRGSWLLRRRALLCLVPATLALAVSGVAVLVVLVVTGAPPGSWRWPALAAASAVATIGTCVAIGASVGRAVPRAVTAPVLTLALWAAVVGLLPAGRAWLRAGGAGHSLAGFELSAELAAHRWLVLATLTVVAVLGVSAGSPGTWGRYRRTALAVSSTATAALVLGSGWFGSQVTDLRPDPGSVASECAAFGQVDVCAMPEHRRHLDTVGPALQAVAAAQAGLGLPQPLRAREVTPHEVLRSGGVRGRTSPVLDFAISSGQPDPAQVALSAVVPATCYAAADALRPDQMERYSASVDVLAAWTRTLVGTEPIPSPAWSSFTALPPEAQRTWLREALAAHASCRPDRAPRG